MWLKHLEWHKRPTKHEGGKTLLLWLRLFFLYLQKNAYGVTTSVLLNNDLKWFTINMFTEVYRWWLALWISISSSILSWECNSCWREAVKMIVTCRFPTKTFSYTVVFCPFVVLSHLLCESLVLLMIISLFQVLSTIVFVK